MSFADLDSSLVCPSDPALGSTHTTDFTKGADDLWTLADGTSLTYSSDGANFVIDKATDAPTISASKYIFFGKVSVVTRAAPGTGIVSSFILESDDLDEIDWEWLGGNDATVESNFFGKGNTTTYNRAIYEDVADPINTWHTYTIDWTSSAIQWYIDDNLVRTLNYGDALALYGKNYPQTPMLVKIGNWVGCASAAAASDPATEGTCSWAGGPADFSAAPFTMSVKSITIQDYGCATEYTYGDKSGDWQSIQSTGGCSGGSPSSGSSSSGSSSSSDSTGSSSVTKAASTSKASTAVGSSSSSTTSIGSTSNYTTATNTNSSATGSSSSTTSGSTVPSNGASGLYPSFGSLDIAIAIAAVGLSLGYLIM